MLPWRRLRRKMLLHAQMCLEMLIALALRNRDRLLLIWPLVHDYLAAILAPQVRAETTSSSHQHVPSCSVPGTISVTLVTDACMSSRRACSPQLLNPHPRRPAQNGARGASMLVARGAAGVLRCAQRLLPYGGEAGRALLGSLQLLLRLSPAAAWDLAQPISAEARAPLVAPIPVPKAMCRARGPIP